MDGVNGVAGVNAAQTGQQQQQSGGLSAAEQEQFNVALAQAAGGLAAMNFTLLRSIMSQANKPPQ
ncbi:MAG: hypothetical protein OEU92_34560 [Alphaproteobacteria bacterium]|nr:hypothetical protein [Alphaproteobacteria bacterium]